MRKRFYNWLYDYAQRKYVQHVMTDMQRFIFKSMEDNPVYITEDLEMVVEVDDDTISAVESERAVKH